MGTTLLPVRVANPADEQRTAEVECSVDSGAIYADSCGRPELRAMRLLMM